MIGPDVALEAALGAVADAATFPVADPPTDTTDDVADGHTATFLDTTAGVCAGSGGTGSFTALMPATAATLSADTGTEEATAVPEGNTETTPANSVNDNPPATPRPPSNRRRRTRTTRQPPPETPEKNTPTTLENPKSAPLNTETLAADTDN